MGHYYSEYYPEECTRQNELYKKQDKIYREIKNKKLSDFTVEQLELILLLIDCRPSLTSREEIGESDLKRIEGWLK
jgi:hypothetical protein